MLALLSLGLFCCCRLMVFAQQTALSVSTMLCASADVVESERAMDSHACCGAVNPSRGQSPPPVPTTAPLPGAPCPLLPRVPPPRAALPAPPGMTLLLLLAPPVSSGLPVGAAPAGVPVGVAPAAGPRVGAAPAAPTTAAAAGGRRTDLGSWWALAPWRLWQRWPRRAAEDLQHLLQEAGGLARQPLVPLFSAALTEQAAAVATAPGGLGLSTGLCIF